MEIPSAIDRIIELLDSSKLETVNTSTRIPNALREAATLAVDELGAAASTTALTTAALRATLEALVMNPRRQQPADGSLIRFGRPWL